MTPPDTNHDQNALARYGIAAAIIAALFALGALLWTLLPESLQLPWVGITVACFVIAATLWVIALLPPKAERNLQWLEQEHLGKSYRMRLNATLDKVDGVLSKGIDREQHPVAFYWSADLLGLTLLLALAYPLLTMVVQWLLGDGAAMLGTLEVFKPLTHTWERVVLGAILVLAALLLLLLLLLQRKIAGVTNFWVMTTLAILLMTGVWALGFMQKWHLLTFSLGFSAFASFVTNVSVAYFFYSFRSFSKSYSIFFLSFFYAFCLIALMAAVASLSAPLNDGWRSGLLFLGFLPLVNALFDYFSIGLTRYMLYQSTRAKLPWLWGIGDVVAAVGLFIVLKLSLVALLVLLHDASGAPLVTLLGDSGLFAAMKANPHDYIWLYVTLFSTLIPTVIHLNLACYSFVASRSTRLQNSLRWVAQTLRVARADPLKTFGAFVLLASVSTAFLVVPMMAVSHVWQFTVGFYTDILAASRELAEGWGYFISQFLGYS